MAYNNECRLTKDSLRGKGQCTINISVAQDYIDLWLSRRKETLKIARIYNYTTDYVSVLCNSEYYPSQTASVSLAHMQCQTESFKTSAT